MASKQGGTCVFSPCAVPGPIPARPGSDCGSARAHSELGRAAAARRSSRDCSLLGAGPKDYGSLDDKTSREAYDRAVGRGRNGWHACCPGTCRVPGVPLASVLLWPDLSPSRCRFLPAVLQGGAKLVDHPLYQKPQLRTKMRSIIPRLLGLCCILVVVMMGCGYMMYTQLAAGYVQIKPGTAHFSTVAKMAARQQESEAREDTAGALRPGVRKSRKVSLKKILKSTEHGRPSDTGA
jgi:hypothetical protein